MAWIVYDPRSARVIPTKKHGQRIADLVLVDPLKEPGTVMLFESARRATEWLQDWLSARGGRLEDMQVKEITLAFGWDPGDLAD